MSFGRTADAKSRSKEAVRRNVLDVCVDVAREPASWVVLAEEREADLQVVVGDALPLVALVELTEVVEMGSVTGQLPRRAVSRTNGDVGRPQLHQRPQVRHGLDEAGPLGANRQLVDLHGAFASEDHRALGVLWLGKYRAQRIAKLDELIGLKSVPRHQRNRLARQPRERGDRRLTWRGRKRARHWRSAGE